MLGRSETGREEDSVELTSDCSLDYFPFLEFVMLASPNQTDGIRLL